MQIRDCTRQNDFHGLEPSFMQIRDCTGQYNFHDLNARGKRWVGTIFLYIIITDSTRCFVLDNRNKHNINVTTIWQKDGHSHSANQSLNTLPHYAILHLMRLRRFPGWCDLRCNDRKDVQSQNTRKTSG